MFTPLWTGRTLAFLLFIYSVSLSAAEIRVHYDTDFGNNIAIRGDGAGLNWSSGVSATWTTGNIWVLSTQPSAGGFEFKPLFNDTNWSIGANYVVPDGNAVVDVYPFFWASQGTLQIINSFTSQILGNTRSLRIYLPPSYSENPFKSYPVVYMHDGQNLFQAQTSAFGVEWEVDETADSLVVSGQMRETIFVGMDNAGASRIWEYTTTSDPSYGGGGGEGYLDFIEQEVMPWVNANYRTQSGAEDTIIMGSSLGGLISFCGAWSRPDVFGTAVAMSSSFWWDGASTVTNIETYSGPWIDARFYVDIGANEGSVAQSQDMAAALLDLGYQSTVNTWFHLDPFGSHNEASWRDRLHLPLSAVLPWQ